MSQSTLTHTPLISSESRQLKKHLKVKIPKSQAKVVSDIEMQALQVEACAKIFYSYLTTKQTGQAFLSPSNLSLFDSEYIYSDIQVYKFMQLFMQCFDVGSEIVVAALIYLERLQTMNNGVTLNEDNAKSFLHAALTLASKFYLDKFEKNTIFYAVGGLSKNNMRHMLDTYLELIQFKLYISDVEFNSKMSSIKTMIAQKFAQLGQIVVLERNLRRKSQATNTLPIKSQGSFESLQQIPKCLTQSNFDTKHQPMQRQESCSSITSSTGPESIESDSIKSDNESQSGSQNGSAKKTKNRNVSVKNQPKKKSVCTIF